MADLTHKSAVVGFAAPARDHFEDVITVRKGKSQHQPHQRTWPSQIVKIHCGQLDLAPGQELLVAKRDLKLPRRLRKLVNFDILIVHDLGQLSQGAEESEVLFTLISESYERRSLEITSNLVFLERERILANPIATAAAIDRVDHSVILEFDVPSYHTDTPQQRGQAEEVNRQN